MNNNDSGTFGSPQQMNAIAKGQQASRAAYNAKPPFTKAGSALTKQQLTKPMPVKLAMAGKMK